MSAEVIQHTHRAPQARWRMVVDRASHRAACRRHRRHHRGKLARARPGHPPRARACAPARCRASAGRRRAPGCRRRPPTWPGHPRRNARRAEARNTGVPLDAVPSTSDDYEILSAAELAGISQARD
ncbi:MAG: hypothetical protein IPL62_13100 [Caulobacteraceae bacterium]|nr:hypothetical protein [Caulobacteraceae bacterium]